MIKKLYIDNKALEAMQDNDTIEQLVQQLSTRAHDDFEKTTATWSKRPTFTVTRVWRGRDLVHEVSTDNEIYRYVNDGTRPHRIEPKGKANGGADSLRFQTGYSAKTRPRQVKSFEGGPSGAVRFSDGVQHPGTDARDFDKEIVKRSERRLKGLVRAYEKSTSK